MKLIGVIFALLLAAMARAGATSAEFPLNDGGYIVAVRITNDTADKTIRTNVQRIPDTTVTASSADTVEVG